MGEPRINIQPIKIGLNRTEAAHHIGISEPTFDKLVVAGKMPPAIKIFGRNVWDRRAIDAAFAKMGALEGAPSGDDDQDDGW